MSRLPRELFSPAANEHGKRDSGRCDTTTTTTMTTTNLYVWCYILFFYQPGVRSLSLTSIRTPATRWISIIAPMSLRASETLQDTSVLRYNGISIATKRSQSRQRCRRRNSTPLDVLKGTARNIQKRDKGWSTKGRYTDKGVAEGYGDPQTNLYLVTGQSKIAV